jgi:AbrB family looped-hinge helix DNA binding protein
MTTLTVTAKGQVTLRKDVLEHLGVRAGDKISVEKLPGGKVEVSAAPKGKISDVFGMLYDPDGPRFTIEEIKEFTERAWAGDFDDNSRHQPVRSRNRTRRPKTSAGG